MDRTQRSEQTYARLFGPRDIDSPDRDPEFSAILRRLVFGEVFHLGIWTSEPGSSSRSRCWPRCRPCPS